MCFTLKTTAKRCPRPQIAKEDIVVYKVIWKSGYGPYYTLEINGKSEAYKPGNWYVETTPFIGWEKAWTFWDNEYIGYEFDGNCFHSCATKEEAQKLLIERECCNYHYVDQFKIVKMIIPKGAKYYRNETEYISSEIIYPYSQKGL